MTADTSSWVGPTTGRDPRASTPRSLRATSVCAVLAVSFARIHWQNLANFGVLAIEFVDPDDYGRIEQEDVLVIPDLRSAISSGPQVKVRNATRGQEYIAHHRLSARQVAMLLAGGLLPWLRQQEKKPTP